MIETVTREVTRCTCRKCKHVWDTFAPVDRPPAKCPACHSREWNQKFKRGRPFTIKITTPKPKRVRLEN